VKGSQKSWGALLFPHIPGAPLNNWLGKLPSGLPLHGGSAPSHPWRTDALILGIRKDIPDDKKDAAWRFVRYMVSKQGEQNNTLWGAYPTRPDVAFPGLGAKWQKIFAWHKETGKFAERR